VFVFYLHESIAMKLALATLCPSRSSNIMTFAVGLHSVQSKHQLPGRKNDLARIISLQHFACDQVASIDYAEATVERVPDMVVSVIFRNGQIQNFSSKTG
jgi:hypothetical protein